MNECIELHDSMLVALFFNDGKTVISFSPVYIHRSRGTPGVDSGSVWLQSATLTITGTSLGPVAEFPLRVSDGSLRIGDKLYSNCIPSCGMFNSPVELCMVLDSAESVIIRGDHLTIELHGEPSHLEDFQS